MSTYRERIIDVLRTRCVHLCTKEALQPLPDADVEENPHDTAVWWCARSSEALGPDDSAAEPGTCDAPGRDCYQAPPGPAA